MDPTFQYAGKVRIPPKEFQLRARIEPSTRNTTNVKQYEHWQTDTPDFTYSFPKMVYSKGRMYETVNDRPIGYSRISDEENRRLTQQAYGTTNTYKEIYGASGVSNISYKNPESDRAPIYNREVVQSTTDLITGYKTPNYRITNIPYMDMAPTNTRTDKRDYKQSQPFVAGGPDLAYNPYFDRYDPVTDPRNAVRELRSVVYEDKGGSRGEFESQKLLRRNFENRWLCNETIDDDMMDSLMRYEIINQKQLQ
jgi:hypothetical protein